MCIIYTQPHINSRQKTISIPCTDEEIEEADEREEGNKGTIEEEWKRCRGESEQRSSEKKERRWARNQEKEKKQHERNTENEDEVK